jgi:tRNA modification GTPase
VAAVVEAACRVGCRLAKGGEFSLRSFLAGRIDLLQAEAVLAVIDARSPEELTAALDAASGGIGRQLERLRDQLLDLLGDVEAVIDFGDEVGEGQGAGGVEAGLADRLDGLLGELTAMAGNLRQRAAVASSGLPRVVLAGPANVGKSSLFNALAGQSKALVADEPGTTRDWVEVEIEGPLPFMLVDLAGFEDSEDRRDAVAAASRELARADLVIDCRDAGQPEVAAVHSAGQAGPPRILVATRCDRVPEVHDSSASERLPTSSRSGEGLARLREAIHAQLGILTREGSPATVRMAAAIAAAQEAAAVGREMLGTSGLDEAMLAAELGRMLAALDEAVGRDLGNDLLDRIFARHCIGK